MLASKVIFFALVVQGPIFLAEIAQCLMANSTNGAASPFSKLE
jgi:hypothetical protein